MKKWISKLYGYTPLLYAADYKSPKILDLSYGVIVESLEQLNGFDKVVYIKADNVKIYGWILSDYIEPYQENLPHDIVNFSGLQTPDPTDAKQYFDYGGFKQVNFCLDQF